jgi:peptide/nickel transport system ATP-binding protein
MYLGRIVEIGTTEQVLNAPQHPYTRALLSVVPEIEQIEPIVLTGETPDPSRIPSGCRFHPRCPALQAGEAEAAGIADKCTGQKLPIIAAESDHHAACWLVGALAR